MEVCIKYISAGVESNNTVEAVNVYGERVVDPESA
jgi:hypothetical protein